MRIRICPILGAAFGLIMLTACDHEPRIAVSGACATGDVIETDGYRRLALVVGVGDYASEDISDLDGTVPDARSIQALLADEDGYAFPEENICMLLDADATMANFVDSFEQFLIGSAREGDVAVVYFAGHGSQARDSNGDEPDMWDETFAFHDTDGWGNGELADDEFHQLLQRLHERTRHIVAIIDSCNSGTATRGSSGLRARFIPRSSRSSPRESAEDAGDGADDWAPDSLPGLVALTAASDGTPALESQGRGIFTEALVSVLTEARSEPMTYAQLSRRVPLLVASRSYQIPYFQGDLNRNVFGNMSGTRPRGWDVVRIQPLELSGPPMTGISAGAEFRIYDGAASATDVADPARAKATAIVSETTGLNADAFVSATTEGASAIEPGDLAVLVRPGDESIRIRVAIRDAGLPGGVDTARAGRLRAAIEGDPDVAPTIELVNEGDEFELSVDENDRLVLRGPENRIRNTYTEERTVPPSLAQHARQRALLLLNGDGGSDFVDHQTLSVQLVEAPDQSSCANGVWQQAEPFEEQIVPLCHSWNVKVTLSETSPMPLLIGGVILSSDGAAYGFPADGRAVELGPGEEVVFSARNETFVGSVPLDVQDHVIVFGTQRTNPVAWNQLTQSAAARAAATRGTGSPLFSALGGYLSPGTRGVNRQIQAAEDTTWTMSSLSLRVTANQAFVTPAPGSTVSNPREYSIRNFDIRPYLPDDQSSALYAVMMQMEWLVGASRREGFGYRQHAWTEDSDLANLALGIDCSRAIWFAFTRSGLDYNDTNRYLTTADMVAEDSWMADEFEQCPVDDSPRLGDVLAYRSDERNDGHVVMVIDPEKRIGWGSHGWDGNARESDYVIEPDTGVEYQLIKYKQDWQRWDRPDMEFKQCWRYRRFEEEAESGIGLPGQTALDSVCADDLCFL